MRSSSARQAALPSTAAGRPREAMTGPFVFIGTHRIAEAQLDASKKNARAPVQLVREREPQAGVALSVQPHLLAGFTRIPAQDWTNRRPCSAVLSSGHRTWSEGS